MKLQHDHTHSGNCCCGGAHGHRHTQYKHNVINAGSCCCSTCSTEAAASTPKDDCDRSCCMENSGDGEEGDPPKPSISVNPAICSDRRAKKHSQNSKNEINCSCCSGSLSLGRNEEEESEDSDEFKRDMLLLGAIGAIFAFLLIFEDAIEGITTIYPLYAAYIALYLTCGLPILTVALKAVGKLDFFNEFTLMSAATIAAIGIGELSEAVGVMLFYRIGEAFQEKAAARSRRSVKALLAQKPMFARIVRGEDEINASPKDVRKGDIVKVLPGEMIPIDGIVQSGVSLIDNSAITGESLPISAYVGINVQGGTLSLDGMLMIEASGPFADSTIARIIEMVQNAVERKSQTERFITRFAKLYTPTVFAAAGTALIPPLAGRGDFSDWLYRALVMMVISCPCALVISIPLGFFGGIGAASRRGILVKGASVFDTLTKTTIVIFDKTGTLTRGIFEVADVIPAQKITREELLAAAAMAESGSSHPIAKSIRNAAMPAAAPPENSQITQVSGKGMVLEAEGVTIAAGNAALMSDFGFNAPDVQNDGTIVYLLKNQRYLGYITISDVVKEESAMAVKNLKELDIQGVYMLTGDRKTAAERIALRLGLDGFRAELLPDGKVNALEDISHNNTAQVIFVGDGANDGPALASAGIGIAMGGLGSQVAVEVSDAVILDDSPAKVAELIKIGRKTRKIIWQNVVLAISVKGIFIALGAIGLANLWEAVFADVGVALLAVLNATRTAKI